MPAFGLIQSLADQALFRAVSTRETTEQAPQHWRGISNFQTYSTFDRLILCDSDLAARAGRDALFEELQRQGGVPETQFRYIDHRGKSEKLKNLKVVRATEVIAATALNNVRAKLDGESPDGADTARRKTAPPPSPSRAGVMHKRHFPAFTYAMVLEGTREPAFKIGWAHDWKQRERQLNQTSLPHLGGVRYRTLLHHHWSSAKKAFRMEQTLLRHFDRLRHKYNFEVVVPLPKDELEAVWQGYILSHPDRQRSSVLALAR